MSFAEIPPTCTNPINIIQTQTPKHIAKKQAKLFLPNFGFLRPIKYKAAADSRSPELREKTTGMRRNSASIFWTSGRRPKSNLQVRIHAPQLLTLSSAILSNQPSVSSSSEPPLRAIVLLITLFPKALYITTLALLFFQSVLCNEIQGADCQRASADCSD